MYDPNPFSVATDAAAGSSVLSITATPTPATMKGTGTGQGNGYTTQPYISGMLSTGQGGLQQPAYTEPYNYSDGFSQQYGYFEMRCEVPNSPGMWPAFWLLPQPIAGTTTPNTEYDIFEIPVSSANPANGNTRTIYQTSHLNGSGAGQKVYRLPNGGDASTAYHTYGFEWDTTSIRWFVDGVLTETLPNVSNSPMYMLMNLAVGGTWPGNAVPADLPQSFKIDYARVYSDDSAVPAITPQASYGVSGDTLDAIDVAPEPTLGFACLAGLIYVAGRRRGDQRNLLLHSRPPPSTRRR